MGCRWSWMVLGVAWATLAGGCWFDAARPVTYYDLQPVKLDGMLEGVPVMISEFENYSPAGSRIMLRYPDGIMREAPDCKWVQNPGELVTRRLSASMSGSDAAGDTLRCVQVRGRITEFTVDIAEKNFALDGFYLLQAPGAPEFRRNFRIRAALDGTDSAAWARGASAAVGELAGMLNADLLREESR